MLKGVEILTNKRIQLRTGKKYMHKSVEMFTTDDVRLLLI